MTSHFKNDIPASIVVFLVALPLCLGVALASGAPLLAGIISGIIGGIVVGFLSKSQTSVSGPAAGLAAVVLSAITSLGGFEVFLTALIIAGFIQLAMGLLKAGFIADYIPSNVIKGLLAAIGVILILKQIPHAIGFDKDAEDDFSFFQPDGENTFSELLTAVDFITPGAILISVLSMLILIFWDKTPLNRLKFLPPSLLVVILGVILSALFQNYVPFLALEHEHLVNIPRIDTQNLANYIHFPSTASLLNHKVWLAAFSIAVIASIETLLNIEAVDKIDPEKRISPPNSELVAQGIGNILSGFLGGIPITSVIVRSSVNIQSGNKTQLSAILHGLFMLLSVLLLSPIMNMIPLASLAAILLMTGYKLAKIEIFKDMYQKGWHQFIPFVVTIVAIVFTDLLIGVVLGLVVSIFYLLKSNYLNPFEKEENKLHIGEVLKLELPKQVSFINKASIKDTLWKVLPNSKVLIDASHVDFIDNDVLEVMDDFKNVIAPQKNIQLNILGLKDRYQIKDHIQFINVLDKATQQKLTPGEVLEILRLGNQRFIDGKWTDKYYLHQINITSLSQNPMCVIVGCIDSRTSPEIIFDSGLGDLLTIRIAGNIISPEVIGSLELAVEKIGIKLIVVKGHSNCGAISASLLDLGDNNMRTITSKIQRAVKQCGCADKPANEVNKENITQIIQQNVHNSLADILANSPYLKSKIEKKEIGIVGAYHDLSTGKVSFNEVL